ncbi:MAG TPA: hypothetical protein VLJ15_05335 [Gammaproteobacteria bacterium]|nr:hypothetical protein [Gammaproteobacteria bacterium]
MRSNHAGSTSVMQKKMNAVTTKKAFIIGDYDNCFDIFFRELKNKFAGQPGLLNVLLGLEKDLGTYLDWITRGATVYFINGSRRQSISSDEEGNASNKNGLCLPNYVALCEKRGWILCQRLYADKVNNVPSGTAFQNREYDFGEELDKRLLLEDIFDEIRRDHPNDRELPIYFFDDMLKGILLPVKQHFEAEENSLKVPPNAVFTLVNFNWFEQFRTGWLPKETIVREVGTIKGIRELTEQDLRANLLSVLPPGTPRLSPRHKEVVFLAFNYVPNFVAPPPSPVVEVDSTSSSSKDSSVSSSVPTTEEPSPPSSLTGSESGSDPATPPVGKTAPRLFCCCRKKVPVVEGSASNDHVPLRRWRRRGGQRAQF